MRSGEKRRGWRADASGTEEVVELRNIHENNGAAEDVAPYTGSYDGIVAFERNGGTYGGEEIQSTRPVKAVIV